MKISVFIAVFVVLLLSIPCFMIVNLHAIVLSDNGKSNYVIVISNEASLSEEHAASELQKFLHEIDGADFPVLRDNQPVSGPMILLGKSGKLKEVDSSINFAELGNEGYVLKTSGENLIIAGGRLRGTMYGVYGFLEEILGCRWYTDQISKIPAVKSITIDALDMRQIPSFEYREILWKEAFDKDWAARNKLNGSFTELDEVRGGKMRYVGNHNYYPLIPPAKYFEDHPEYYSEVSLRRYSEHAQLCETNPELIKLITQHIFEWIDREPDMSIYNVTPNDWGGMCECGHCQNIVKAEGGGSGPYVAFINSIAERVEKYYPGKFIAMAPYKESEIPPRTKVPRDNVVVRMAPIDGCKMHTIEDCPLNETAKINITGWARISKKMYIWDYFTNFRNYLLPFPDVRCIPAYLHFYKNNGIKGLLMQGCHTTRGAYLSELKAYLEAKLLWNIDRDADSVINDFLTGVYGSAADAVLEYVNLFENTVRNPQYHADIREDASVEYLTKDVLQKAEEILDKAEKDAEGDPVIAFRIELLRLPLMFVKLSQPIPHHVEGNFYVPEKSATEYANTRTLDLFMEKVHKHTIEELRESSGLQEQYLRMKANVSAHQIVTIESPYLRAEFIPTLGGRIFRLVYKTTGKDVLRIPDASDFRYPSAGGLEERLNRGDTVNKGQGYFEPYTYTISDTPRGKMITLTGRVSSRREDDAVLFTREIILLNNEPSLEIKSRVKLLSRGVGPLTINSGLGLDIGPSSEMRIGIKQPDGSTHWYDKTDMTEINSQDERFREHANLRNFFGREVAAGKWCVLNKQTGLGIIDTYEPGQVDVCLVKAGSRPNDFEMRAWSLEKELSVGKELQLNQKITITDKVAELMDPM